MGPSGDEPRDGPSVDVLERGMAYAFSLAHDRTTAEDLLQEACLSVLKAGGDWTRGYLFAAIRTRFLDRCRRERLVTIEPVEDPGELGVSDVPEALGDGELFEVESEELLEALGELRPAQREALYLAAIEGYTAREIAELTDRPRGTVLSLLHRARGRLRRRLEGHPAARGGIS